MDNEMSEIFKLGVAASKVDAIPCNPYHDLTINNELWRLGFDQKEIDDENLNIFIKKLLDESKSNMLSLSSQLDKLLVEIEIIQDKNKHLTLTLREIDNKIVEEVLIDKSKLLIKSLISLNDRKDQQTKLYYNSVISNKGLIELIQSSCPHTKKKFDYTDNHKGCDYYKCLTCGARI